MGKIIDISVPIFSGMPFFPGDPGAEIVQARSISKGHVANITELRLGSHAGTHVDAPHHFEEGEGVDRMALDVLVGPARVVDLTGAVGTITREQLVDAGVDGVTRLLMKTTNSKLMSAERFSEDYVALSEEAAAYLLEIGVRLVGIDYLSIESFRSETYGVHHSLLGAGVVVLEGIDLDQVDAGDYELICLPLKVRDGDGAPARVILITR